MPLQRIGNRSISQFEKRVKPNNPTRIVAKDPKCQHEYNLCLYLNFQNCVIKVRRPAPKVPVRNPNTSLSNPRQTDEALANSNGQGQDSQDTRANALAEENHQTDPRVSEEEDEESIYQPIWQS